MKLKQKLAATVIATLAATAATTVLAEAPTPLPVANAFTTTEMASLFEQGTPPGQLRGQSAAHGHLTVPWLVERSKA